MNKVRILSVVVLCGAAVSCKDSYLNQQPVGAFAESALTNAAGVNKLLIGAYSMVNGIGGMAAGVGQELFGDIRGGDSHKGSTLGDQPQMVQIQRYEVNTGNSSSQAFFQYFYNAIFRANQTLGEMAKAKDMTDAQKLQVTAEARFLRGHFYFMLKRLFKNIPWIDEAATDAGSFKVPNTDASGNFVDIWPLIQADFDFARKNLPETQTDLGRPNKWAAEAYYGKVLLYMGNDGAATYAEALTTFTNVIANGKTSNGLKYALLANYHDNFDASKENHAEWVFGSQHSVNDATTTAFPNGNQDIQYIGSQNSGAGAPQGCACYGFDNPSQWFVDKFRVDASGLPIQDDATRIANGIKNDNGVPDAVAFTPDAGPIDPRLDWAVGRRGIQYLDWGVMRKSWIRAPDDASSNMSKKWFTYKSQTALYNGVTNALNTPIIRYADVLLMAAELEARTGGSLTKAMDYVNQIRNRMATNTGSATNWVKNADGVTNAANYKISPYPAGSAAFATADAALKTILFERTLELGQEGHRGYDLVRFGNADAKAGKTGDQLTDVKEFNAYIKFESGLRGYLSGAVYSRGVDELMPIPQNALDYSFDNGKRTLTQNPGY